MSDVIVLSEEALSLSLIPLFNKLDDTDLERLAEEVEQLSFHAGEAVFSEHDRAEAVYVVEKGAIRLWVRDEDVKQVTLSELKAGDFFGELALLGEGDYSTNATALVNSTLHRLRRDDFHQFMLDHPAVAVDLISGIGAHLRQTNRIITGRAARDINKEMEKTLTRGQRVADRVASFGGSWPFIIIYVGILLIWISVNTFLLARVRGDAQFDPFPYILLNLVLSMTATMQAPVILMSQKRALDKDRFTAEQDFRVNLKSELMLDELTLSETEYDQQVERLINAVRFKQTRAVDDRVE